ncbi:MAG: 30S ribosomal protein S2 [Hyphomicrobiales bacterium]|nr:30S ribosomal protein S2 [Hyphomicrobiales bacterium]
MSLPEFSMKELLEAGVHFGHQTHRWNPKMKDFIYGEHNNIHIIDLSQTMGMLKNALGAVREVTQSGGRILFVGTKRQASETISESASQCAQYYVNHRWLGGTLTNWKTISNTIARLKSIQETLDEEESAGLTKKELLKLTRERDKLELSIGGIKNMGSLPDLIFVIDTVREQIAIKEANKLNIPIAAIIDTNCDPEGITYPIPGNDDSTKSIKLYCDLVSQAALDGISIQSQKVQEETQDKKEKPQKETASKEDNKSKELSDTPKTDDGKEIENLEENNDKSKSEEKD